MVRVKGGDDENVHAELRAASAISNPYLSAAVMLAAGLIGLSEQRELQPAVDGPSEENPDLPKLAQSLEEGLDALAEDTVIREMLGEEFFQVFTAVKRFELDRFRSHVTDWERNEYMEVY